MPLIFIEANVERVRVLHIISGFAIEGPLGGIERFGVELAKAFPADIEPIVCGMWDYGTPGDAYWQAHLRERGIQAFTGAPWTGASPYRSFRASLAGTKQMLAGQQIDLIHSHCQFGDPLAMALQHSVGAKALLRTVHNEKEWPRRPERRLLFTNGVAVLAFQREIGVSQTVVDTLNRRPLAKLLHKQAALCYNAVALDRFRTAPSAEAQRDYRQQLGLPATGRLIGSVGRLEPQKGYQDLIEAMPAIVTTHPDVHLVIAGTGSLLPDLQAHVAASPVAHHIHLVGAQPDIEKFYALLSLFVSSSLWEGLPTVILEAMAARVPVVATDVSGSRELVEKGKTGWLVPAGNIVTLAQGVIKALQDSAQTVFVETALQQLSRFDIQHAARFHRDLYYHIAQKEW